MEDAMTWGTSFAIAALLSAIAKFLDKFTTCWRGFSVQINCWSSGTYSSSELLPEGQVMPQPVRASGAQKRMQLIEQRTAQFVVLQTCLMQQTGEAAR
jgi:hypothetical protein